MPLQKRNGESGQAILIVAVSMGIFLLGATGLAIDASHLYAQRQMAQAAADAGAIAGIVSVFDNYNAASNTAGFGTTGAFPTNAGFTCGISSQQTPCFYAQTLNGFNDTNEVAVDFPAAGTVGVPAGSLSGSDPVNLVRVTVSRAVPTTLMRFLNPGTSTMTIKASATAAIVQVDSPIPIVVTHPSMTGAMQSNGNNVMKVCGGPSQSIQVNSTNPNGVSMNNNTTVDLRKAGPLSTGTCLDADTGANFGVWGGPAMPNWTNSLGAGAYIQPNDPIRDPFRNVTPPVVASTVIPAKSTIGMGVNGCPVATCTLYTPGYYTTDIDVSMETAVFAPGIYYMYGSNFFIESNGDAYMATGLTDPKTGTGWNGQNMLVYLTGPTSGGLVSSGRIKIKANGIATLAGSPIGSPYLGILFFANRASVGHNSTNSPNNPHALSGGGAITLRGTVYLNNDDASVGASTYQELNLQGNAGSATKVEGEVVVNAINFGGGTNLTMNLSPSTVTIRKIALVQ